MEYTLTLTDYILNFFSFALLLSVCLFLAYGLYRGVQHEKEMRLRRRRGYS